MKILSRKMQEVKEIRSTFSMGNKREREHKSKQSYMGVPLLTEDKHRR